MSTFITGKDLETAVDSVIWEAEHDLLIVSPYIKLDEHFKKLFRKHLNNPNLQLTIMFGKNEGQVNKSFNKTDLEFFLQFPNIAIVYVPNLHAKYYANEFTGVLTSINLYDYSFKNNIEFGVLFEPKGLSGFIGKNPDSEVWDTCLDIAEENEVVYVKRPVFEKKLFSKNYLSSKILLDRTQELYSGKPLAKGTKKLDDFEKELRHGEDHTERPVRETVEKPIREVAEKPKPVTQYQAQSNHTENFTPGFCIRTGVKIPFNPKAPFSADAYKSWSKFGNEDFKEKYCHYSGEPSNGETSMSRPILHRNWKKSQEYKK